MKNIILLSEITGLDYLETTEGTNGYPKNIKKVLDASKLKDFKEVEEIALKYDLEIIQIHQKEGWQLWESKGWTNKPFEISAEDYGDNYHHFNKLNEYDFINDEVKPMLQDLETFEEIENLLKEKKEIFEAIEEMEDDEIVITNYGCYSETVKQISLSWSHDTHIYKIALAIK